jgi:hypothetical protein
MSKEATPQERASRRSCQEGKHIVDFPERAVGLKPLDGFHVRRQVLGTYLDVAEKCFETNQPPDVCNCCKTFHLLLVYHHDSRLILPF